MLSKLTLFVPFWDTIRWYSPEARRKAIPKFLVLWLMSLAPLALSALVQEIPENEGMIFSFFSKFWKSFFARHQFIYAVSFITPIFYLAWDRHSDLLDYFLAGKRSLSGIKLIPPGFGAVLIWSLIFFLVTTVAYANSEVRANTPNARTILGAASDYLTVIVYLFGLMCWYFMMLDAYASPTSEYYHATEQEEKDSEKQAQEFSKRIAKNSKNEE